MDALIDNIGQLGCKNFLYLICFVTWILKLLISET